MCVGMGVPVTFRILFLPDYLDPRRRRETTSSMWRMLRQQLPGCEIQIHIGSAPFEDDYGIEFHFDSTRTKEPRAKQLKSLRRDLYTSVAVVLREVRRHKPHVVYGVGQGGLVALAMARPLLVEAARVACFFQEPEVTQVAEA